MEATLIGQCAHCGYEVRGQGFVTYSHGVEVWCDQRHATQAGR